MPLSRDQKLAAMYARDRAQDGRYLVCVLSTGIYCLPSCPARKPRAANVRFLADPAAARRAGFRPCLRCRPDDFHQGVDRTGERLAAAVDEARRRPADVADVPALAARTGCGVTTLTALVRAHYHLTPATLLARLRVAHAAAALGRGESVAAAGYDAGFESSTAYYANFRRQLGVSPGEYRAMAQPAGRATADVALRLPAGFVPGPLCELVARDASHASERLDEVNVGGRRCPRLLKGFEYATSRGSRQAVLELVLGGREARLRVHAPDGCAVLPARATLEAHRIAVRLLGFASEVTILRKRLAQNDPLRPLLATTPGLRVPLMASAFEALVWALLGQQVNLAFAASLRASLIRLAAGTDEPSATLLPHPAPAAVAALDPDALHARRFSRSKAQWLVALAGAAAAGTLDLDVLATAPAGTLKSALTAHKGIGDWTAEYVMLRGMGLNDCVPASDAGLSRALERALALPARPDAAAVHARLAVYSPCRSLVCQHLWASLGAASRPAAAAPALPV